MSSDLFGQTPAPTANDARIKAARVLRDKTCPPCPHGHTFITLCGICTPPLEKDEGQLCDELMEKLGWSVVKFSQPFKAAQTKGISDRRYYPPEYNPRGHAPFWHEHKRKNEKTNESTKKGQAGFERLVTSRGELYVRGGLSELSAFLREQKIADVGI